MVFLKFSGQILKRAIKTLQILRLKLIQTCISSKLIMQFPNTISLDSAIFVKIKLSQWQIDCVEKMENSGEKKS
jgi:hypothetical protein